MSGLREEIKKLFMDIREENVEEIEEVESVDKALINTYIFVDLDNTSYAELGTIKLDEHAVFSLYTDKQHVPMLDSSSMRKLLKDNKSEVRKIQSHVSHNSTDFKIICDVATALAQPGVEYVYIISKDGDYDEAIDHLREIYGGKVKAIEKFKTLKECLDDKKLMESTGKEELKQNLVSQFFRPYRAEAINELLEMLG